MENALDSVIIFSNTNGIINISNHSIFPKEDISISPFSTPTIPILTTHSLCPKISSLSISLFYLINKQYITIPPKQALFAPLLHCPSAFPSGLDYFVKPNIYSIMQP